MIIRALHQKISLFTFPLILTSCLMEMDVNTNSTSCPTGYARSDALCIEITDERCGNDVDNFVKCENNQHCVANDAGKYVCQCRSGFGMCAGSAICGINFNNDLQHCGRCGNQCKKGEKCIGGSCLCADEDGKAVTDYANNDDHCGTCGNQCTNGNQCIDGLCACKEQNEPGKTMASCPNNPNCSVDIANDPQNCGQCSLECPPQNNDASEGICEKGICKCADNFNLCLIEDKHRCVENSKSSCGPECQQCPEDAQCANGDCVCNDPKKKLIEVGNDLLCLDTKNNAYYCGEQLINCKHSTNGEIYCSEGKCVQCAHDNHCGGQTPYCFEGKCVQCTNNGQCGDGICDKNQCKCSDEKKFCGSACVDLNNDPQNCGACGNQCTNGRCINGQCICNPYAYYSDKCGNTCVNLNNDPLNCGACGNRCGRGVNAGKNQCHQGKCVECTDDAQCGSGFCFNNSCGCDQDSQCSGGRCQNGMCKCDSQNLVSCNNRCVVLNNDPLNCGACGNRCGQGINAGKNQCHQGKCVKCTNDRQCGKSKYCCTEHDCGRTAYWGDNYYTFDLRNTCGQCHRDWDCANPTLGCHVFKYGSAPNHGFIKLCKCKSDTDCKNGKKCINQLYCSY